MAMEEDVGKVLTFGDLKVGDKFVLLNPPGGYNAEGESLLMKTLQGGIDLKYAGLLASVPNGFKVIKILL